MKIIIVNFLDRIIVCLVAIWLYQTINQQPTVVYNGDLMQCKIEKYKPQTVIFIRCIGFDKELTKYLNNSKEVL